MKMLKRAPEKSQVSPALIELWSRLGPVDLNALCAAVTSNLWTREEFQNLQVISATFGYLPSKYKDEDEAVIFAGMCLCSAEPQKYFQKGEILV